MDDVAIEEDLQVSPRRWEPKHGGKPMGKWENYGKTTIGNHRNPRKTMGKCHWLVVNDRKTIGKPSENGPVHGFVAGFSWDLSWEFIGFTLL